MGSTGGENEQMVQLQKDFICGGGDSQCLQKFKLYETRSNFLMIGRDKSRTCWKVLKINKLEFSELCITEDPTTYSEIECYDLLRRLHTGNGSSGGLKFVTTCYGIIGFIKFLGPYYMLLVTKRRKTGMICGHAVYSVAKSEMIPITNSALLSNVDYAKNENRYKKLLKSVDFTKNFFFSYSYHVMRTLQKNLSYDDSRLFIYETMFVWNEFLTRGIRSQLRNFTWTVALVYGFFKQVRLSVSGRDFTLMLVARRSRHYAGTRYLKRGVNDKGRVANDVETEQIVIEDIQERSPVQISSIVQNRGSIPLFWSQETSRLNIKPDIMLSKKDDKYEATKLHFKNLVKRYGNPIIILNLIKTREKKPRESILRAEFANAIDVINKDLPHNNHLKFLHWDFSKYSRNKAVCVLSYLAKVAENALDLTGFFHCQVLPSSCSMSNNNCMDEDMCFITEENSATSNTINGRDADGHLFVKSLVFQNGVLRTNCIDCLDRTNVAQYAYGLVALGHQLHAMGYLDSPSINIHSPLADDLMKIYEAMGDTLAQQYGGSAAHNKIFSERRGQWKAAIQSQEFLRSLQRFYSNVCMDAEKQDAINVLLGHFQPQLGKPALWELDSDQHYDLRRLGSNIGEDTVRPSLKRSLSDGNMLRDSNSPIDVVQMDTSLITLPVKLEAHNVGLSESTPASSCDSEIAYSQYTQSMSRRQRLLFSDPLEVCFENNSLKVKDGSKCSNFVDFDGLSSSGNSWEEELYERSLLIGSPSSGGTGMSSGEIRVGYNTSSSSFVSASSVKGNEGVVGDDWCGGSVPGYSESFVQWVAHGSTLFR